MKYIAWVISLKKQVLLARSRTECVYFIHMILQAKNITEAEVKYDRLLKTLDPRLATNYQRRCEEATREGMSPPSFEI